MKASDLTQAIKESMETLRKETDQARQSEVFLQWLDVMAKFHQYSVGNQILIWSARPDATHVAGFHTWLKLHRYVRKGEKGIPILAPITFVKAKRSKGEDGEEVDAAGIVHSFKPVYVFDVAQTDGEELPELVWLPMGGDNGLVERLGGLFERLNIRVERRDLAGAKGFSAGGLVVVKEGLEDAATAAVMIHELAHELAHQHGKRRKFKLSQAQVEGEAEATAYVVCRHFGIEAKSGVYLANWGVDEDVMAAAMGAISKLSGFMITALEDPAYDVKEFLARELREAA